MLTVKCQGCGALYKLSEDLYSRKAAGFGVVVTCRRCKGEIHVEAQPETGGAKVAPTPNAEPITSAEASTEPVTSTEPTMSADPPPTAEAAPKAEAPRDTKTNEAALEPAPSPVTKAASPSPPRVTPKATAPWPEALASPPGESPSPLPVVEATAAPAAPKVGVKTRAESASSPEAALAPQLPRPAPRPPAPAGTKPLVKRDPVSGPFVALSPGLLGIGRPAPLSSAAPDSEAPVDSSDFIDERKPKAPGRPPPAKSEQQAPPKRTPEPPLKFKEPPKPPKQKPRAPVRADDVSDDLLSADVGFEGTPSLEGEAPRILAPDSSALAAPPPEIEERESPKGALPSASTSDAKPRPSSAGKPSRVVPIVLVSLGAAAAFGLAFRSQLPGASAPPEANRTPAAAPSVNPPLPPPLPESPLPPPPTSEATSPPATTSAAATPTPTPKAEARTTTEATAKSTGNSSSTSTSSETAKPAIIAPAPGTPVAAEPKSSEPEGPFNAEAARAALASSVAQASSCRKPGDPSGVAVVTITFSPSGRVTSATIGGPPFAGTPTGGCIAATLRRARVPAFTGDMVTVKKTVEIQ